MSIATTLPPPQFHPWILANPESEAKKLSQQAFFYKSLSKITLVAIAVISVVVFATSFTTVVPAVALPFILFGFVMTTPFFGVIASHFQKKGNDFEQRANIERIVAKNLQKIQNSKEEDLLAFFNEHKIIVPTNIPLSRLSPLVARFLTRSTQALEAKKNADLCLKVEDITDREIRLRCRQMGWKILEEEAIPAALESAFILQILKNPYLQSYLKDVCTLQPKSFEERQFDLCYGPQDPYLYFSDPTKKALDLSSLTNDLSPDALREQLFA